MIIACFQCVCLGGLFNLAVRLMQLFSTTEDVNYVHLTSLLGLYFQVSNSVKAVARQHGQSSNTRQSKILLWGEGGRQASAREESENHSSSTILKKTVKMVLGSYTPVSVPHSLFKLTKIFDWFWHCVTVQRSVWYINIPYIDGSLAVYRIFTFSVFLSLL